MESMKGGTLFWPLADVLNLCAGRSDNVNRTDLPKEHSGVLIASHAVAPGAWWYRNDLTFLSQAVHPVVCKIKVGKSISYNPYNDPIRERFRIRNALECSIQEMYLNIAL